MDIGIQKPANARYGFDEIAVGRTKFFSVHNQRDIDRLRSAFFHYGRRNNERFRSRTVKRNGKVGIEVMRVA